MLPRTRSSQSATVSWRAAIGFVLVAGLVSGACSQSDAKSGSADASAPAIADEAPRLAEDPLADLERRSFPLLIWAAHTVGEEYFDKERFDPDKQLESALVGLGMHVPEFFGARRDDALHVRVRSHERSFPLLGIDSVLAAANRLEGVLEFAQAELALAGEPLHELEYAATNGLFAPLDPHTVLLTPEEHTDLGVRTKGQFGGIGAEIRADTRRIVLARVLPGMPAAKAGLVDNDVILQIDGESTVNMSPHAAQLLLRGPVGTEVVLKVRRGKESLTVAIQRDTIRIDSVRAQLLPDNVAYVKITNFQENTAEQVQRAVHGLASDPSTLRGLVFDVRGNAGGLLVQATAVVDQLVPRGELVIVRSAHGREVDDAEPDLMVPESTGVVVLVDEDSASAAEIVSGGLQALGRGVVLGRTSFGKGTVQMVRPAVPYGRELALKLTIAEYLVAGDQRIQTFGVVPDLELVPVETTRIPGVVRYYDLERFERQRERSKVAHLPSAQHERAGQARTPGAAIHYLLRDVSPPNEQTALAAGELELMRDPEIRIARDVALELTGAARVDERREILRRVAALIEAQEDARITGALRSIDVDWRRAPADVPVPPLRITAQVVGEGPLPAGRPFTLRIEVANEGTMPAHRVHVITDCVHDELDGIELMLGKIEPGTAQTRDVALHVMPWHSDFSDELTLDVHAGDPDPVPDASTRVRFSVMGAARPSFAYDWWIVDDPALAARAPARPPAEAIPGEPPFTVAGNGDGMLQPGERVLLAFAVRNDGPGTSEDVRALVRNLTGRQGLLEEGLYAVGPLAPGQEKTGAFGITIAEAADPELPFELDLVLGDATLRVSVQDKLRLPVLARGTPFVPEVSAFEVAAERLQLYGGADVRASVVAEAGRGVDLVAAGRIGEFFVIEQADRGRRLFVRAGEDERASVSARESELAALEWRTAVLPPGIELGAAPRSVGAASIHIEGIARHPRRVRDVVVMVRPPGPSQLDRKVQYVAAADDANALPFAAEVPLELGGNRITILARDDANVQRRAEVWVFREE